MSSRASRRGPYRTMRWNAAPSQHCLVQLLCARAETPNLIAVMAADANNSQTWPLVFAATANVSSVRTLASHSVPLPLFHSLPLSSLPLLSLHPPHSLTLSRLPFSAGGRVPETTTKGCLWFFICLDGSDPCSLRLCVLCEQGLWGNGGQTVSSGSSRALHVCFTRHVRELNIYAASYPRVISPQDFPPAQGRGKK